jgi:hypothetical protein
MDNSSENHPWVFHRDDVDLLEDQLEDLYERFQSDSHSPISMEQEVLQEQLQTEEDSDAELSLLLGEAFMGSVCDHNTSWSSLSSFDSMKDSDQDDGVFDFFRARDPLYLQVRSWSLGVFRYAQIQYFQKGNHSREVFRVYVNANLIPIKLATATQEACVDDRLAREIALKEYALACTYLERTLSDLLFLRSKELSSPFLSQMIQGGRQLLQLIRRKRELLKRQHRFL